MYKEDWNAMIRERGRKLGDISIIKFKTQHN